MLLMHGVRGQLRSNMIVREGLGIVWSSPFWSWSSNRCGMKMSICIGRRERRFVGMITGGGTF
jgi:hypothetical protein